ncbi:uncharacterized protein KY384_008892 [Bacidia gigantensis]|uniref:uncharacterized protein n=1 Tax=Bacidia gigantensis TaxID=2732470 RepID=UPI001D04391B|nr:uncharacterized protein KY384_008892 [Bacidia gigantensis]KAG8525248.1 hypothetical protein KY384_008892 [Bacidia gigantensis]
MLVGVRRNMNHGQYQECHPIRAARAALNREYYHESAIIHVTAKTWDSWTPG